jgi:hypothetical protein
MALIEAHSDVPFDIWRERAFIGNAFVSRAAADRARAVDRGDAAVGDEAWVANLVDMFVGMMTAPVTPAGG